MNGSLKDQMYIMLISILRATLPLNPSKQFHLQEHFVKRDGILTCSH